MTPTEREYRRLIALKRRRARIDARKRDPLARAQPVVIRQPKPKEET